MWVFSHINHRREESAQVRIHNCNLSPCARFTPADSITGSLGCECVILVETSDSFSLQLSPRNHSKQFCRENIQIWPDSAGTQTHPALQHYYWNIHKFTRVAKTTMLLIGPAEQGGMCCSMDVTDSLPSTDRHTSFSSFYSSVFLLLIVGHFSPGFLFFFYFFTPGRVGRLQQKPS